jgi:C4-dicarboxylate-specific signal transduction histidine kinase
MEQDSSAADSPLVFARQVYRLRILGLGLGFLCVAAVFHDRHASLAKWSLLAGYAFLWPHLAWWRTRTSRDINHTERVNLLVDSVFGGILVALMEFSLLPSALIVAMLCMDKVAWGRRFLVRASGAMVASCAVTAVVARASFLPETSVLAIAASLPLMVAYPIAVNAASNQWGRIARERKKAVEQADALREQLAHTARIGTLGEMAAGLAHELNQPLTAIHLEASTALELASRDDFNAVRECLSRITDESLHAGEIVRRIRGFARRERTSRNPVDLRQLIHQVLALLDRELRLNRIETTLDLAPVLPPTNVDTVEIQQVLVNLVRNAIEAMTKSPDGLRRLWIGAEVVDRCVRVSITDTGDGIDPATQLFVPFHSTKPNGMGLGLAISRSLVEAHGGRIGAGPHPSGGAKFFFDLPFGPEQQRS